MAIAAKVKRGKNNIIIPDIVVNRIETICNEHDVNIQDFIVGAIFSAIMAFEKQNKCKPSAKKRVVKKAPSKKKASVKKKVAVKKRPVKKAATKKRRK
jgi:hypothetical protein